MDQETKNNIIRFYEERVWQQGMLESHFLTDEELENVAETLAFAKWMLAKSCDDLKKSIKDIAETLIKYF